MDIYEKLFQLAHSEELPTIKSIFQDQDIDVNYSNDEGKTLLMVEAYQGTIHVI